MQLFRFFATGEAEWSEFRLTLQGLQRSMAQILPERLKEFDEGIV